MKKILCSLLCGITLFGSILLAGCGDTPKSEYEDLKSIVYDIQKNSADLYRDEIKIIGKAHSQYNGAITSYNSYSVKLQDIILTDNCLLERPESNMGKYWFYFDIEEISFDTQIIWKMN